MWACYCYDGILTPTNEPAFCIMLWCKYRLVEKYSIYFSKWYYQLILNCLFGAGHILTNTAVEQCEVLTPLRQKLVIGHNTASVLAIFDPHNISLQELS